MQESNPFRATPDGPPAGNTFRFPAAGSTLLRSNAMKALRSNHQGLPVLLHLAALAATALIGCSGPWDVPEEPSPRLISIVGAKLIDGSGAEPIEDSVVVTEGTRIRAAGSRSDTPVPKGSEIVDGIGKTVIPGLIELHAHYFGDRAEMERLLAVQLRFGVTTSRSIGADQVGFPS